MQLLPADADIMCTCQTLVCLNHLAHWAVCILQNLVLPQLASSSAEQPLKQQLHGSTVLHSEMLAEAKLFLKHNKQYAVGMWIMTWLEQRCSREGVGLLSVEACAN